MKTTPVIVFGANGLRTRDDATFAATVGGLQSVASLADLKVEVPDVAYATFEPDYWLLDGNFKFMPAGATVGYISTDMSGSASNFTVPVPLITITFGSVHSTTGLTLYFSAVTGDWADSITISFYDASNVLIRSDTYTPSSAVFATGQAVSNFKKITIAFNSTNKAYRFARLRGIDFDTLTRFTGADIKAARLIEEINPLALELPNNTLELTLFSAGGDFSIVDPAGVYADLHYKDPLDAYEVINGVNVFLGRYYLDRWESRSENEAVFFASDAIGLLDGATYVGDYWLYSYTGVLSHIKLAGDLVAEIFAAAGVAYELDASFDDVFITGHLPVDGSCRNALQQLCFKLGAYATCARSNVVRIVPMELASELVSYDYTITAGQKGLGQPVTLKPLVTGVEVDSHTFVKDNVNSFQLFDGDLTTGSYTFYSEKGIIGFVSTSNPNWTTPNYPGSDYATHFIGVTITANGFFTFYTQGFRDVIKTHAINNGTLPAGTPANIVKVTDGMLADEPDIANITQRVYDYFQQRYSQKVRLYGELLTVGNSALVDTQSGRQIAGIVERMETDLAGGFISDAEIVGVVVPL